MKIVILTMVALLWWQCGYSQNVCDIKKKKNVSIARVDTPFFYYQLVKSIDKQNSTDACLKVLVPTDIKIKLHHIRQIYSAHASSIGGQISRMAIHPYVVNKNGVGIYSIYIGNDSLGKSRCVLYNGKQMVIPFVPDMSALSSDIPEEIYQARLEVVETFLKKHNDFTEEQKEKITRIFTNGTIYTPSIRRRL